MTDYQPLQDLQRQQGAEFAPDQASDQTGASLPSNFGNSPAEFAAATARAALFDLGLRTQLELTGADRQKYLHNFCSNEIRNLRPGQSCEAFLTTIQGKIKAHIFVFAEEQSLWIDARPGYEELLFNHLDKYLITENVEFHRHSGQFVDFYVSGPETLAKLAEFGLPVAGLVPQTHVRGSVDRQPVAIRRVDWLGQPGCLLQVPGTSTAVVWKQLTDGGLIPAGNAVFESLRILAGFPHHGIDLTDDNLAQEAARTSQAISFTKGCYLGQEPIARIDSMGHVNQELRVLRMATGPTPRAGDKVVLPGEVREAGVITSAAWDFTANAPIALALLKRNYLPPGTKLHVVCDQQEVPATVFAKS